jgi:hypothetical protein
MNSFLKSFFVFIAITVATNAQTLPDAFQQLLNQTNMQFSMPQDFEATPIINNGDVAYDFALKSVTAELEIRYRIWPIDKNQKNPNDLYGPMMTTMGLNISNGKIIQPQQYPTESVKSEFSADAGSTGLVPIDSQFGKGFKLCVISVIHKDNVADAYVFYLYNDPKTIMQALTSGNIFHALKFK